MPDITLPFSDTPVYAPTGEKIELAVGLGLNASDTWYFPWGATMSIGSPKDIVRRQVAKKRSDGTVKELWSLADFEITLTGWLMSMDGTYPDADVRKLRSLHEAGQALVITSRQTALLGIEFVVTYDLNLPASGKGVDSQAFQLKAWSDKKFQLFIE